MSIERKLSAIQTYLSKSGVTVEQVGDGLIGSDFILFYDANQPCIEFNDGAAFRGAEFERGLVRIG